MVFAIIGLQRCNQKLLSAEKLAGIKTWDLGDIVSVTGTLQRSGKGGLFVDMNGVELLTKSLRPVLEKHKGLTDTEQRYVDLITNEHSRDVFCTRSKIIPGIRDYFLKQNFMEVEALMLQVIPGGTTARPFMAYHNALDTDLRIAPELYLKRVVVGEFERVFEINRNSRNESLSTRRDSEFTVIEFYQAYADCNGMMDLYRSLLSI